MVVHFKSYFHYFYWDRIQSGMQWGAYIGFSPVVTMVTHRFLGDSPVFPAGSSLRRCSHINLILSMFHQSGHIRFLIYVYLHTKQHFLTFYVFVAICFGSSPFFKQTAWTNSSDHNVLWPTSKGLQGCVVEMTCRRDDKGAHWQFSCSYHVNKITVMCHQCYCDTIQHNFSLWPSFMFPK